MPQYRRLGEEVAKSVKEMLDKGLKGVEIHARLAQAERKLNIKTTREFVVKLKAGVAPSDAVAITEGRGKKFKIGKVAGEVMGDVERMAGTPCVATKSQIATKLGVSKTTVSRMTISWG